MVLRQIALLVVLLPLDAEAIVDTCVFTADTTCSSVTRCSGTQPVCTGGEGNLSGGDDLWQVGDGRNEITTLSFAAAQIGDTFTVSIAGRTSEPIAYSPDAVALAVNLRAGLHGMSNVGPHDVGPECSPTSCSLRWKGAWGCQDVSVTCAGSGMTCTPSTTTAGSPGTVDFVEVRLDGFEQAAGGAIGIDQRCNGRVRSESASGRTLTIGPAGWLSEPGAHITLRGGVRQVGTASPAARSLPYTSADFWRVWDVENCPAADCSRRRLFFHEQSPAGTAAENPHYYEALGSVATTDIVCIPLGSSSMDEGFCYEVTAVGRGDPCTGSNCYIEIDARQSATNSVGLSAVRKGILRAGLAEPVEIGEGAYDPLADAVVDPIRVDDGVIAVDDDFVGWCVYIGDVPHRVRRTTASADSIELLSERGSRAAAPDSDSVFFSRSCHQAGDEIAVLAPIRVESATPGLASSAEQEDTDITWAGQLAIDGVVVKRSGGMIVLDSILGSITNVWSLDRGLTNGEAFHFLDVVDTNVGVLTATGGPDTIGGTYAMCTSVATCNWHGLGVFGGEGWTVDFFGARHLGDDCVAGYESGGRNLISRIKLLRCETKLGVVHSMETLNTTITVDALLAIDATGLGSPGQTGLVFDPTPIGTQVVKSAAVIRGERLTSAVGTIHLRNLYAVRMDETRTNDAGSLFEGSRSYLRSVGNWVVEDWTSTDDLELAEGCMRLSNGILLPGLWTEHPSETTGVDWLFRVDECSLGVPLWIRNNAVVDIDVVPGGAQTLRFVDFASSAAYGEFTNNLIYWRARPPDSEPDQIFFDSGYDLSNIRVGGNAVIGFNDTVNYVWSVDPADSVEMFAGQLPMYFADNVRDYPPENAHDFPARTTVGPRPSFAPHSFVAAYGSQMKSIGAGAWPPLGVCTTQPWHRWLGIDVAQTCWGAPKLAPAFHLYGVAAGGAVRVTISGVAIAVTTVAGQPCEAVIAALAAAVNADLALSGRGVLAEGSGSTFLTNGTASGLTIDDARLSTSTTAIPVLPAAWGGLALAAALAVAGVLRLREV